MKKTIANFIQCDNAEVILDSIADGVFTVDRDMTITFFNRAAEEIIGIQREAALGQFCFDILRANICETTCVLRSTLREGGNIINKRVNFLRRDGKTIPVSISTSILRNQDNEIIGGVETFRDLSRIEELKRELKKTYTFQDIVSRNQTVLKIFDILPNIANTVSTVLIEGPSGSGKELFAQAIHNLSSRKRKPFVAINCGALPETLLESELFGYVQGAFTDAKKNKPGRLALAEGGTIFLDEVDSLPKSIQVKLLRVLQEREYEPLGAVTAVKTNVRVIAATKQDLLDLVHKEKFRDDLYFRLNVVKIKLPALAKRRDDIPLLVDHLIEKLNNKMECDIIGVSHEVLSALLRYDFPGNIRELENIIEYAFIMVRTGQIELEHLPDDFREAEIKSNKESLASRTPYQDIEKKLIEQALINNHGNRQLAARELDLHRSSLWRKMKKYGLV